MPHAFALGHISIKDPAKWAEYRDRVPGTLAPFGGELMFRGKLAATLSGKHAHTDTVAIRFADLATAQAWHDSPAYQALIPLRQQAADITLLLFEE